MKLLATALLAVMASGTVMADCSYPRAPAKMPNGELATLEEMVTAKKDVEQYNKEMEAYLACIQLEHDDTVARQGQALTSEQKQQMEQRHAKKNDAAVDELKAVAERFNEQVRAYKAKHPTKK